MKNHLRKYIAGCGLIILAATVWTVAARRPKQESPATNFLMTQLRQKKLQKKDPPAKPVSPDEKSVRDIYARLMRYQSAAVDETTPDAKADDYVNFDIRILRTGDVSDVFAHPVSDLSSSVGEDVLSLNGVHLGEKEGARHAYYQASWGSAKGSVQPKRVSEFEGIGEYSRYVSYTVHLRYQGKELKYRAVAVYPEAKSDLTRPHIFDNTVIGINDVAADESARVRSPWEKYVRSSLFQAVARSIKETNQAGQPLIPANAPLGYLPGDNAEPNGDDSLTMARMNSCAGLDVEMSGAQSIKDGSTAQFNVTTEGGTPQSYEWTWTAGSGAGNSPNVNFTGNNTASVTTDGRWFALPNEPCSAGFDAVYTIKCKVIFNNNRTKSDSTTLTVNAYWDPAGFVAPPQVVGGVITGFDSNRGLWVVVGPGTATRVVTPKVINVPSSSQFFTKTDRHEDKHVAQYTSGMNADLYTVAGLMTQLSPLTGRTQSELGRKVQSTTLSWLSAQESLVISRKGQAEAEAYTISDPLTPQFLYQNCGRFP